MTNKIKPFYIKTEGLSAQQIQDALDLCVGNGAEAHERTLRGDAFSIHTYDIQMFSEDWVYFGVDEGNRTLFGDEETDYFNGRNVEPIEITLEQLPAHLGLCENGVVKNSSDDTGKIFTSTPFCEFRNGDLVTYKGEAYTYIGLNPDDVEGCIVKSYGCLEVPLSELTPRNLRQILIDKLTTCANITQEQAEKLIEGGFVNE